MASEIHLFIIWEKGREQEERILSDMFSRFKILGLYKITWPKESFSKNLTRFYGQNLPSSSQKIQHCGDGEFILVVIMDDAPLYKFRKTTKGVQEVNINIFDAKELYRFWTGGGHRIHGTNSIKEVNHDLTLLLGLNASDYLKSIDGLPRPKSVKEAKRLDRQITGYAGWKNINQMLYALNNCTNYVILRNFEGFPENLTYGEHGDIDILGDNEKQLKLVLNASKVFKSKNRVRYTTKVNGQDVYMDFRYIGDGYYDRQWEADLLKRRILCKGLFYIPDNTDYAFSLLYHGLIHKGRIADDYIQRLKEYKVLDDIYVEGNFDHDIAVKSLKEFLKTKGYKISEPTDLSVYYNTSAFGIKESTVHYLNRGLYTAKSRAMNKLKG